MYTVKRKLRAEGGRFTWAGTIVPIDWVSHALDLVPMFGNGKVPANVTSAMSQELYDVFSSTTMQIKRHTTHFMESCNSV